MRACVSLRAGSKAANALAASGALGEGARGAAPYAVIPVREDEPQVSEPVQ